MVRSISCLAVALLVGTPLRAGELDSEFGAEAPTAPALETNSPADAAMATLLAPTLDDGPDAWGASELDDETPAQSWRRGGFRIGFGWGGRGFRLGFGWGGWGWRRGFGWGLGWGPRWGGWGLGWGGWGWRRGFGWGGWGWRRGLAYYPAWGCW